MQMTTVNVANRDQAEGQMGQESVPPERLRMVTTPMVDRQLSYSANPINWYQWNNIGDACDADDDGDGSTMVKITS